MIGLKNLQDARMSPNAAWAVLIVSAVFEAVWATALGLSDGFTKPAPTIVFILAVAVSMIGLAIAMHEISIGTAYAVWTGLGAVLTVTYAIITGTETASPLKILFLVGIVGCTVGLKALGREQGREA
ncbi:DMT family transporter [Populibacterium corticicola]|uniref:DMT family transporter n=1 Tax=Populibacterium corticicola TaxID=1812826 RepID=A0ABW5XC48_9MICO